MTTYPADPLEVDEAGAELDEAPPDPPELVGPPVARTEVPEPVAPVPVADCRDEPCQ